MPGRREFLLRLAGRSGTGDGRKNGAGHSACPAASPANGCSGASALRFPIGRIADFPPGDTRILRERGVAVESLPEGLRARSLDPGRGWFAVEADGSGALYVDRGREWPADRVFSIMTGEAASL